MFIFNMYMYLRCSCKLPSELCIASQIGYSKWSIVVYKCNQFEICSLNYNLAYDNNLGTP